MLAILIAFTIFTSFEFDFSFYKLIYSDIRD